MGNVAYHVVAILVGAVVGVLGSGFHVGVEKLTAAWPAFLDTGLGLDGFPSTPPPRWSPPP
ncbi:hypothetical protein ACFSKM_18200 [Ancylobacter dichloromethanicus]